jgi:hypothetical protein
MAKYKNAEATGYVISRWLSACYTIEYVGIWERVNNPDFNVVEFNNIHIDAIKEEIIPKIVTKEQAMFVYANEADLLNVALFGKTASQCV